MSTFPVHHSLSSSTHPPHCLGRLSSYTVHYHHPHIRPTHSIDFPRPRSGTIIHFAGLVKSFGMCVHHTLPAVRLTIRPYDDRAGPEYYRTTAIPLTYIGYRETGASCTAGSSCVGLAPPVAFALVVCVCFFLGVHSRLAGPMPWYIIRDVLLSYRVTVYLGMDKTTNDNCVSLPALQ
jgi:hypothetical protein